MKLDAMNTLVQGLKRTEVKIDKAAKDLQAAQVNAQNTFASRDVADTVNVGQAADTPEAAAVADENARAAAVGAESGGDFVKPLVDLLQAKTAYKANATALRVTGDVEQTLLDVVGNRRDV